MAFINAYANGYGLITKYMEYLNNNLTVNAIETNEDW